MKKVCVIGHFGFGYKYYDGQTIKTKYVASELKKVYGEDNVECVDTHGSWTTLLKMPRIVKRALKTSESVVILPASNGVLITPRICMFFNRFYHRSLHYAVIGGFLPGLTREKKGLARVLRRFDGIYVEAGSMKTLLDEQGFENVEVMPNFKELAIVPENELKLPAEPYKLCTFSRVMREKGIPDAVEAVKRVNEKAGRTVYTLDIYGAVDPDQTEWFDDLQKSFPEGVKYGGIVEFDKSVEVLKDYYALLFPTTYVYEGFAGTLIDAMAAGVPVIASDWKYNPEVIFDGVNGLVFKSGSVEALTEALEKAATSENWLDMKKNSVVEAHKYLPEIAIKVMTDRIPD